ECENAYEFTTIGMNDMWWCSKDRQFRISDATPSDPDDPTCHPDTNKILKDVWFKFQAPNSTLTFLYPYDSSVIHPEKDPFPPDTRLQLYTIYLYTGNCDKLIPDTCKFYGDGLTLRFRLKKLVPGISYFMKVATPIDSLVPQTEDDTVGNFQFCLLSQPDNPDLCNDFTITSSPDTLIDFGGTASLSAQADTTFAGIEYTWYIGDSVICAQCPSLSVQPLRPTTYQVVASNTDQCVTSRPVQVNVRIRDVDRIIFVPNAFTPNGDRLNDQITVFGSELLQSVLQFDIYDRWGNLAFRKLNFNPNDVELGWDGSGGSQYYSGGTFVYLTRVRFIDGSTKQFQGSFHLLR
ncbi:MAG: gliding motility-associated C-terminal domain-containing protein, partial [Saprospiraceae bacterium]|nr:gliding motility-associated C-terminal domain-containing protein [Saprospiraceae bacterium]